MLRRSTLVEGLGKDAGHKEDGEEKVLYNCFNGRNHRGYIRDD